MIVFFIDKFAKHWRLRPRTYFLLFVVGFLFVAFFAAWRQEYRGRLRQEAEINKMLAVKPRLKGHVEFFNVGTSAKTPAHTSIAMVMSISNVGSTPSIADSWQCYLNMQTPQGVDVVKGEFRSFQEGLAIPRGQNQPIMFERDDALYVKAMKTPIVPGAKVVGAMLCLFQKASLNNLMSSKDNTLVVRFRDVLGEQHQVILPYLNQPNMPGRLDRGEWVDFPGMDRPPAAPPGSK